MNFRTPSRRAFTLIEIMIVIGLIMLVMTAGIPMVWKALTKDPLAKAVNDVLEGCKIARDRAILQNRPFDFVIRNNEDHKADMNVEAAKTRETTTAAVSAGAGAGAPGGAASGQTTHDPGSLVGDFPRPLADDVAVELLAVNFVDHMGAAEARARFYQNGTADEFTVVFMRRGVRRTIMVDIITGVAYEVIK